MKKTYVIVFVVLVFSVIVYFQHAARDRSIEREVYGKDYNEFRINHKIPIIEDSWILRGSNGSYLRWGSAALFNAKDTPQHVSKTVYLEKLRLFAEEDAFNHDHDDSISDRLIAKVYFEDTTRTEFRFSRHFYQHYPPTKEIKVDFIFADSVLKKWGFENLYK